MRLRVYADGACWGNPGPAAVGVVIKDERQRELAEISRYIGQSTNNQAEYQAAIAALKAATKFETDEVVLYLDSELVVRQLAGNYKVKSILLAPLHNEATELSKRLANVSVIHITHRENSEAHALAKAALKESLRR